MLTLSAFKSKVNNDHISGGAMKFSFSLLWANALLFLLFGTSFLVLPEQMALLVTESAPASPAGLTDMRATYGGLSLGIGLFLGYCAHTGAHRPGLLASLARALVCRTGTATRHLSGGGADFNDGSAAHR